MRHEDNGSHITDIGIFAQETDIITTRALSYSIVVLYIKDHGG